MCQINNVALRCLGGMVVSMVLIVTTAYGEVAQPEKGGKVVAVSLQEKQAASQLDKLLNPLHYIRAEFMQHTLEANGKRVQESEGLMTVQRPNLFRWEVKKPFPQTVVSNGKKVWLYDMELEQVTIQKLDARTHTTPALILSEGTADLTKNFRVEGSTKDDISLFTLTPKGENGIFESLQLTFRGKTLKEMMLIDVMGAKTRIEFFNVFSSNKKRLADKDFELDIPPGVDVIDDK